jgi:signal transduction histidine kinase
VSAGDLEINLQVSGSDEVAVVAREVRSMVGKLKELDRMKDDFVNNVSHELRSPLAAIKSYIEILQSGSFGSLTARQLEFIEIIKKATMRLSTFVNNILDIAKIKSGKFELDYAPANLCDIVSDVAQMEQPLFIEKSIESAIAGEREGAELSCDADSIKRVVINLVGNALKFTPARGKITMRVSGGAGTVRCEIADTGPRIDAADLPKLFNRFEQVSGDQVKGERKKGTGLGLAISRDIVEMHGGKKLMRKSE